MMLFQLFSSNSLTEKSFADVTKEYGFKEALSEHQISCALLDFDEMKYFRDEFKMLIANPNLGTWKNEYIKFFDLLISYEEDAKSLGVNYDLEPPLDYDSYHVGVLGSYNFESLVKLKDYISSFNFDDVEKLEHNSDVRWQDLDKINNALLKMLNVLDPSYCMIIYDA